jgi:hypothetical protein
MTRIMRIIADQYSFKIRVNLSALRYPYSIYRPLYLYRLSGWSQIKNRFKIRVNLQDPHHPCSITEHG